MSEVRINLDEVTVRFRMSYHRTVSTASAVVQLVRRAVSGWQPHYFTALDHVSLRIGTGEVVGVIGRNGAGKSTLLRTVSGIYLPDGGSVTINGRVSALLQLGVGFNTALAGRENIILGGLTLGYSRAEIQERMDMILDFADIGEFVDVPMRYYSSGMMGRLSFAMVVAMEPDILLIDETLAVGDLAFQKKSQKAMTDLLSRATCQVIVSHSLSTVQRMCSRAILVDGGRVLADGSPSEVIREYETLMGTNSSDVRWDMAEVVQ